MDRIPEKIDSRFRYVLLAAERAEQLIRGGSPKIETIETKPTRVAMSEISTDLVAWDYGPAPGGRGDGDRDRGSPGGGLIVMRVLLGVCGGIAAYKAADLVRRLKRAGHEVRCALTRGAEALAG